MAHHVCPYWVGYLLASPLRRLIHKPERIVGPFVAPGMTVLDIGPARGFFTLPMARMVGPGGKVIGVDVQETMVRALRKRAAAAGLADRIDARVCPAGTLGLGDLDGQIDFALASAVVHEIPDAGRLLVELSRLLKPGAQALVAEPRGHVPLREFERMLAAATAAGLRVAGGPSIVHSHTALLHRDPARP